LKDRNGNVWFTGPSEGVELIDSAKTIIKSVSKAGGLSDNNIANIKQDKQGLLWAATNQGGVDLIDPKPGASGI
jgi:ligand-binding sensor domain-containing protein